MLDHGAAPPATEPSAPKPPAASPLAALGRRKPVEALVNEGGQGEAVPSAAR